MSEQQQKQKKQEAVVRRSNMFLDFGVCCPSRKIYWLRRT
jgi:hypothetical protein